MSPELRSRVAALLAAKMAASRQGQPTAAPAGQVLGTHTSHQGLPRHYPPGLPQQHQGIYGLAGLPHQHKPTSAGAGHAIPRTGVAGATEGLAAETTGAGFAAPAPAVMPAAVTAAVTPQWKHVPAGHGSVDLVPLLGPAAAAGGGCRGNVGVQPGVALSYKGKTSCKVFSVKVGGCESVIHTKVLQFAGLLQGGVVAMYSCARLCLHIPVYIQTKPQ